MTKYRFCAYDRRVAQINGEPRPCIVSPQRFVFGHDGPYSRPCAVCLMAAAGGETLHSAVPVDTAKSIEVYSTVIMSVWTIWTTLTAALSLHVQAVGKYRRQPSIYDIWSSVASSQLLYILKQWPLNESFLDQYLSLRGLIRVEM